MPTSTGPCCRHPLARAISVLARAHQGATWRRTGPLQELHAVLREYYPGFLQAFGTTTTHLASADARAVLTIALTPAAAAALGHIRQSLTVHAADQ